MSVDSWIKSGEELIECTPKEWRAARQVLENSASVVPLNSDEEADVAIWANLNDPKNGAEQDLLVLSSSNRLILSRAQTWKQPGWSYWVMHDSIRSAAITGWTYQRTDEWGHHTVNDYVRIDFMLRSLDSFSFYKQFDQPKQLIAPAFIMLLLYSSGVEISVSSQEFLMAFEAVQDID